MKRCERCWMSDTRPGSIFKNGVCQACLNYDERKKIDWEDRKRLLRDICDSTAYQRPYNCLIPVSGGKDSHHLVKIMVEDMMMKPLLVTVTDPFEHTKAGIANLENLCRRYNLNHWTYRMSDDLFKRATRGAFERWGEPLRFIEYAIYTIPVLLAQKFGIKLVVFGENSAYEYGSVDTNFAYANTAIHNMCGLLENMIIEWKHIGINEEEVKSIIPTHEAWPKVLYMSYFYPWSSLTSLDVAKKRGFIDLDDTGEWQRKGTIEQFEQIDSIGYMIHLWMKYPKFGFQRVSDIASRRVREGIMALSKAKKLIEEHDREIDPKSLKAFCETCGYTEDEFWAIAVKFDKGYL